MDDITSALIKRIETNDPTLSNVLQLNNRISGGGDETTIIALAKVMESNTIITELYISGINTIKSNTGWKAIFEMLCINKYIKKVIFDESMLDYECAQYFASIVLYNSTNISINNTPRFCCTITHLEIQNNTQIGINGIGAIIDAINSNPEGNVISYLNFDSTIEDTNDIVQKQQLATKFVTLLQQKRSQLKVLYLSGNLLGNKFISLFVTGLKSNTKLEKLRLCGNCITNVGAIAIANVMYYNKTLKELRLWCNNITTKGAVAITQSLRYHPSIQILDIHENNITEYGLIKVFKFLQYNESLKNLFLVSELDSNPDRLILIKWKNTLLYYNDTLCKVGFSSKFITPLVNKNRHKQRSAPKKGLRRRQDIYKWLYNDWINNASNDNDNDNDNDTNIKTEIKKRTLSPTIVDDISNKKAR